MTAFPSYVLHCSLRWTSVLCFGALAPFTVAAQNHSPIDTVLTQVKVIHLAPQTLSQALTYLSHTWGVSILADATVVNNKSATAVNGAFSLHAALNHVLQGSNLRAQISGDAILIQEGHIAQLSTLLVQPEASSTTENSGSYTANWVSLGKGQNIREIPQSVSIITQQRIEDQHLSNIGEVMEQATGVSVDYAGVTGLGGIANSFHIRGFELSNVQVDGASVAAYSQALYNPNMAMYDSAQLIRGADGLYSGTGEPGGTLNLVRKRPTTQRQAKGELTVGRWQRKQGQIDVSGPLAFEGKLRGRTVFAHTDQHFFYKEAKAKNTLFYGIVEMDLSPSTLFSAGLSIDKDDITPWRWGLPRGIDGSDLALPRDTSLFAKWNKYKNTSKDYFVQLEQALDDDWKLSAQLNYVKVDSDAVIASTFGNINPQTGLGASLNPYANVFYSTKKAFDINLQGSFELLGLRHQALLGVDWTDVRDQQDTHQAEFSTPQTVGNIYDFSPGLWDEPSEVWRTRSFYDFGSTQKGIYGRLNARLSDPLTLVLGGRMASYHYTSPARSFNKAGAIISESLTTYKERNIFTPYIGVVYDINNELTAYASMARIHKSQADKLSGPLPGTPLRAIEGKNYELGLKGEYLNGKLNTAAALYRIERQNEASQADPSNYPAVIDERGLTCCWVGDGQIVSQGVELEATGELTPNWSMYAGYTYNRNYNKKADDASYSPLTPKHLFKLWTTYRLPQQWHAWTVGAGVHVQSENFAQGLYVDYNPTDGTYGTVRRSKKIVQAGYAIWNASVQYKMNKDWQLALNVNNVFDKVYYRSLGRNGERAWYGEPRNIMLTLRGGF